MILEVLKGHKWGINYLNPANTTKLRHLNHIVIDAENVFESLFIFDSCKHYNLFGVY